MATTSTVKLVQLSDVPYTDDWSTYEYLVSVNSALKSLQEQVNALSSRIDNEGVVTGGNDTDGWYVKLPDGKLIQGKYFENATNSTDAVWTYPIKFIADEACSVLGTAESDSFGCALMVKTKNKKSATLRAHDFNGQILTNTVKYNVLAIGRWK